MKYSKYAYFGVVFFIIISSAIALNTTIEFKNNIIYKITSDPITVDFTFSNNNTCSGESVVFTSTVSDDGSFTYLWDFGDGSTSTQENPSHDFQATGCGTEDFNVTLTVTDDIDDNQPISTVNHDVTVKRTPEISFSDTNPGAAGPFNNCGNANSSSQFMVNVGNNSTSSSCITTYTIGWGDGASDTNVSFPFSHNYDGFGEYDMTITAIGDNGCQAQKVYTVKNSSNPSGGISGPGDTLNLCAPSGDIQFEITNWGDNTLDTTYEVGYGDGTTVNYTQTELVGSSFYNNTSPSNSLPFPIIPHSYTESSCPGDFVAQLWIRNACAPEPDPATLPNIRIIISPEANFTAPEKGCLNVAVPFINTTVSGFGYNCSLNVEYTWDFGDNSTPVTTSSNENIDHTFNNPGTYIVTLEADNYFCDVSVYSQEICIEGPINPEFTVDNNEGCAPFSTIFNNTTNVNDQCSDSTFKWVIQYTPDYCGTSNGATFINGTTINSEIAEIQFTTSGTYQVSLEGTNPCGITLSTPQEIIVKAPPEVAISPIENFCETISIINPTATVNSCGPDTATYIWSLNIGESPTDWEFVNGTNENSEFPEISFYTPNNYILSLSVSASCGTTTATETFEILPVPTIINTVFEQTLCSETSTEEIIFESSDPNTSYTWTGSSGSDNILGVIASGNSNTIPSHTLTLDSGTTGTVIYTVTPFIVDECLGDSFQFTITVNKAPVITTQPTDGAYCINGSAQELTFMLSGTAIGTTGYQWYYNDTGNNDPTDANSTAVASPEGQEANYQPPTDSTGTLYYFCVISFSGAGSCNEITTAPAAIEVVPNVEISGESPLSQTLCSGATPEDLSFITDSGGTGTIIYQWYASDDIIIDASDAAVGTNTTVFNPGVQSPGAYYYYVTVDVDESLGCADVSSAIFTIEVIEDPEVVITPSEQTI
ncbi:PKD domain-containing protein, partial [Bizionia saleffrena]